jgi:serine/threonine protein kinase
MAPDSTKAMPTYGHGSTSPPIVPASPHRPCEPPAEPAPGNCGTNYTMIKQIGTGGYGKVYLAQHNFTGKQVAIKVIQQSRISRYLEYRGERVPAEVALIADLSHYGIIQYITHFKIHGGWCLVMEYPPGYVDLFELICDRGRLNEKQTKKIIKQTLQAVNHCLSHKVDHRDLKDENLLVDPDTLQVKLIDFGSASQLTEKAYTRFQGTDVYLPPEWYTRNSYLALPATSWAIGCLIFTCLSGDSPFATREEVKRSVIPWEKLPSNKLSDNCWDVLRGCLQTSSRHRMSLKTLSSHPWFNES